MLGHTSRDFQGDLEHDHTAASCTSRPRSSVERQAEGSSSSGSGTTAMIELHVGQEDLCQRVARSPFGTIEPDEGGGCSDLGVHDAPPRTNPGARGRRGKRGVRDGSSQENTVMSDHVWANDGSLSMLDNSHVAAGLWAVECINPNAWPATSAAAS